MENKVLFFFDLTHTKDNNFIWLFTVLFTVFGYLHEGSYSVTKLSIMFHV